MSTRRVFGEGYFFRCFFWAVGVFMWHKVASLSQGVHFGDKGP
jgi:hypothetical protein